MRFIITKIVLLNQRAGDNRTDHNIFENFCGRKKFDSAKVQFSFDPIFSLLNFHFHTDSTNVVIFANLTKTSFCRNLFLGLKNHLPGIS